jgi:hypothetical protein
VTGRPLLAACGVLAAAACGGEAPVAAPVPWTQEQLGSELAIARAGCVRCHEAPAAVAERWTPPAGPALTEAAWWRANDGGAEFLRTHHGGDDAGDLAAWLVALATVPPTMPAATPAAEPTLVVVTPASLERGERLQRELACGACHAPAAFAALAKRVDHGRLAAFLASPSLRRPALVHPPLTAAESSDVAAALLRARAEQSAAIPGFAWTKWQRNIDSPELPELVGSVPSDQGVTDHIAVDAAPGAQDHHYVLRFDTMLTVPAAGEWTFVTGSDDSSWLWLDGALVVRNEDLAPHRRREGKVQLTAGPHELRVMFSQAEGGASLEVSWRGPGVDEEAIPVAAAQASSVRLAPLPPLPIPDAAAVARGRTAARARRCDTCHPIADAELTALPPPAPARPWAALTDRPCPRERGGQALHAAAAAVTSAALDERTQLALAMQRDGCIACHVRDGRGGLPPAVRAELAEVEDLGDEGRLPPDLTAVGRRLRPGWLTKVLTEGHSVRPYLRVRMPALGADRAKQYASWFAAVDAFAHEPEPPFVAAKAAQGRLLAGLGGRNCITCHSCLGHPSTGPQGMDLALQYRRLQPGWFREWLLHPTQLRPGTRMPALWWRADDEARAEVDALWTWLSLGAAAPLPPGVKSADGSLVLAPTDRPRLHGAFLAGVSARCLAVGTPERTHFAWDLTTARLVWLWRGAFLDAGGTWNGRAGKLLEPKGQDWRVLADIAVNGGTARRVLGQTITADGYPVLRIAAGDAEYEDGARARLGANGSEVVRTLRCMRGSITVVFPADASGAIAFVGDVAATSHTLTAGQTLEVVYRW